MTRRARARAIVLIALLGVAVLAFTAWAGLRLSGSRTYQLAGELVTRVPTSDSLVALTFDDGPVATYTDSVLALLARLDVPATFFMVGQSMERHPEVVMRVLAAGHELANHSLTHRALVLRTPSAIRREIEETDALIRAAGQSGPVLVRPPYGKRLLGLPLHLARSGRPVVLWDLEPDTYHRRAEGMVGYVSDRVAPGSIILLHVEISSRTEERRALPLIVAELRARGYRFVTLSRLIASGERAAEDNR
jgi:peptidoglycan/xylan/chitin deacetylase (PgdA/CDA1 family)